MKAQTSKVAYSIERGGDGVRAVCSCGWRTEIMGSAGLAGAAWDEHVRTQHTGRDSEHGVRGGS